MELRHLTALLAVEEHGGFSAAADALGTVQSNVSAHVARLERDIGATLVDRGAGRLTEEGLAVAERARRIGAELDALVADVAAIRHEVRGTARIGIIGTTARWLVPRLLDEVGARHPGVRLVVLEAVSTALDTQLASGRLEMAVVTLPIASSELVSESLFDEDLVLVVGASHPLGRARGRLAMDDLIDVPLLLPPAGTPFRDELDAAASRAGVALVARAELDGLRLIASLALEGHGPAILPATAIPAWVQTDLRQVPVEGLPRRRVGVARRKRGLPSAPARAVVEVLHDVVASGMAEHPNLHPPGPVSPRR